MSKCDQTKVNILKVLKDETIIFFIDKNTFNSGSCVV